MKRFVFALLLTLSVSTLCGCSTTPPPKKGASAPLQTEGTIQPPKGCVDLRERGGAC